MVQIAAAHQVPVRTLQRRFKFRDKPVSPFKAAHTSGPLQQLSKESEEKVLEALRAEQAGGFRHAAINKAFIAAQAKNAGEAAGTPFKGTPSRNWVDAFIKRQGVFSKGTVRKLVQVRAKVTQESLTSWSDTFRALLLKTFGRGACTNPTVARRLWNADETGFSDLDRGGQHTYSIAGTPNRHLDIVSCQLADHLTVMVCISASGHAMPPFAISTGEKVQAAWGVGAPGGTSIHVAPSASMCRALFPEFIRHFIRSFPPGYDTSKPTVLLLDNHNSRQSTEAMELCKANNIIPFGLLSNATHFLQPCDRFVIAHYKKAFHSAAHKWWSENNMSRVPKSAIGHLLAAAQPALTPQCVRASFFSF